MDAMRVLLLTQGPFHPAWGPDASRDYRYLAIYFEYYWISLSFLMANFEFLFALAYLALSV